MFPSSGFSERSTSRHSCAEDKSPFFFWQIQMKKLLASELWMCPINLIIYPPHTLQDTILETLAAPEGRVSVTVSLYISRGCCWLLLGTGTRQDNCQWPCSGGGRPDPANISIWMKTKLLRFPFLRWLLVGHRSSVGETITGFCLLVITGEALESNYHAHTLCVSLDYY